MQETKKQIERLLITYFRDCYPAFPKGNVRPSESPDFIVRGKLGKKIGIELVRLFPATNIQLAGSNTSAAIGNELVETVKELFERTSSLKVFIKIRFSNKNFEEERLLPVSAFLANLIRKSVANRNERSFYFQRFSSKELTGGIEGLLLVHYPGLEESVWEVAGDCGISENLVSSLQATISKKEGKLPLYRKKRLDEYWLLITCDTLGSASNFKLIDPILNEPWDSEFQRILLFDLMNSKVVELKMPSS